MIIVSYDISDNKKRTKFSKYLSKFGYRLQYSVFRIENSERILNIIKSDIENNFAKDFTQDDSIFIFKTSKTCEIIKYGYAENESDDIFII